MFLTIGVIYFIMVVSVVTMVLVFLFVGERRKFLVQNKLEYLQKKYAKLGNKEQKMY